MIGGEFHEMPPPNSWLSGQKIKYTIKYIWQHLVIHLIAAEAHIKKISIFRHVNWLLSIAVPVFQSYPLVDK